MATRAPDRSRLAQPSVARLASVLKAVADERRLRILVTLGREELCVCELVDALRLPQYEVSKHLALLKRVRLVVDRREGLWVYYSIPESAWRDPILGRFVLALTEYEATATQERSVDFQRLRERLALRDGNRCVIGFQK